METSKCITYFMSGEIKEFKKKKKRYRFPQRHYVPPPLTAGGNLKEN